MPSLLQWIEHLGLIAIFALVLVEQIGIPLPSYPLLIIAGSWSTRGGASPPQIIEVAVAASLIADYGWYLAGQRLGSRVLRGMCRLSLEPDSCVSDSEKVFARFGNRVLLVAKFVPGLGAVATAMSGVVGASLLGFAFYDLVGSVLWAGSGVALGAIFHDAVDDVFVEIGRLGKVGGLLIAGLLACFLALKYWRRHQFFVQLRTSRISVAELARLLTLDPKPTVIDARSPESRARDGTIPGALPVSTIDTDLANVRFDGEVVVYCACPNEATAARIAKHLIARGFQRVRPLEGGIHAWQDAGYAIEFGGRAA